VIDASGGTSRQVDLIVHRLAHYPFFEIGGVRHFPVESVVAVLENKASMASSRDLKQALENVESVKRLDRSNGGENNVLGGAFQATSERVDPNRWTHQIFGALITEQSLSRDAVKMQLFDFMAARERRLWPNMYVDVSNLIIKYGREPGLAQPEPHQADFLLVSPRIGDTPRILPLVELAYEIINFSLAADWIQFSPTAYLGVRHGGRFDRWPLP
jgi:hypothetical protein